MDIRNFFSPVTSSKSKDKSKDTFPVNKSKPDKNSRHRDAEEIKQPKKRASLRIDSDSDEDPVPKNAKKKEKVEEIVIECDSDTEKEDIKSSKKLSKKSVPIKNKSKADNSSKLKPATVSSYFSDAPVQRSDAANNSKKRKVEVVVNVEGLSGKQKEVKETHKEGDRISALKPHDKALRTSPQKKDTSQLNEQECASSTVTKLSPAKYRSSDPKTFTNSAEGKNATLSKRTNELPAKSEALDETPSKKTFEISRRKSSAVQIDEELVIPNDNVNKHTSQKPKPSDDTSSKSGKKLQKSENPTSSKPGKTVVSTPAETTSAPIEKTSPEDKSQTALAENKSNIQGKESNKNSSPDDKASAEKKRAHFLGYKRFMEREGPKALGTKSFPKGKEGCFHGLSFVITGVLESFERDEVKEEIEKYKGKVVQSVSKKTSYIIVGRDAGESKLQKAEKFGTKLLNEDEFLSLIESSNKSDDDTPKGRSKTPPSTNSVKEKTKSVTKEKIDKKRMHSPADDEIPEFTTKKPTKRKIEYEMDELPQLKKSCPVEKGDVFQMWVDKYKPTSTKQIIGQQGDKSNVKKLTKWLLSWHKNRISGRKPFAGKWGGPDDGSSFRAALLSGPPGIGKTTSAQLVCKETGFEFIELNASDQRSKRSLKEEVSELLGNQTLSEFYAGKTENGVTSKHVVIMDEVDGMSGNEDRGGVQELIALIKTTKVPIICICNDRAHPKIRSLVNYCFDLRFYKPRVDQIKGAALSIAFKEGVKIPPSVLQDIIVASNQDIRQVLHNLSVWSSNEKSLTAEQTKHDIGKGTKDVKVSPFDALRQVFQSQIEGKPVSVYDRLDLFFTDYSIMPLFVHENYLQVQPSAARGGVLKHLHLLSSAADSIGDGDLVDKAIRTNNNWSLLPTEAIFATAVPGDLMKGYLTNMIAFPSWLGKNSSKGRMDRLLQELHMHMRLRISGNKTDVGLDYIRLLRDSITRPLIEKENEGVSESLKVLEHYSLLREDVDNVVELSLWPSQSDPMSQINSKVKAAFTRAYNKEGIKNPYSVTFMKKVKRGSANELDLPLEDEEAGEQEDLEESDDDLTRDAMVKVKRPKLTKTKEVPETSGTKGKGRGKASGSGRGRAKK